LVISQLQDIIRIFIISKIETIKQGLKSKNRYY
jgi:hypothetical protein